ncbi:Uncharacterized protein OBRU01_07972 [Operophtera brumata]|uniref:C2H2-type domain-containing protein n=1 Tax=Operophtera brumata TaxID=104452 RepID=A0A0L7L7C7_OPEBR|nr:Uncharacterized protein OBRU01_07972 [Operophtera brumata]
MFGSSAQLGRHMKSHEKIARGAQFHCAFCGKGYYDTFTLQVSTVLRHVHAAIHTNERPFTCDICNTAFQTNSSLKRHTRIVSTHERASLHVRNLQHGPSRATSATRPFTCDICNTAFQTNSSLKRHTRIVSTHERAALHVRHLQHGLPDQL